MNKSFLHLPNGIFIEKIFIDANYFWAAVETSLEAVRAINRLNWYW